MGGSGASDADIAIRWVKLASLDGPPSFNTAMETDNDAACLLAPPTPSSRETARAYPDDFGPSLAHLSGIFSKGFRRKKERKSAVAPPSISLPIVPFVPARGTYAYDALERKFKEFDVDNKGYISEHDLKVALKSLNLPASEESVQDFLSSTVSTTWTRPITFEKFSEYAIQQENELVDTFKELDKWKTGYITVSDMKKALRKYKFSLLEKDVKRMVTRFHRRVVIPGSQGIHNNGSQVLDFAEFREILILSSIKDLRDPCKIWGRAIIDLGDVNISFPLSSGKSHKMRQWDPDRPKRQVLRHLLAGGVAAAVSRTLVAPLERAKVLSMVNPSCAKEGLPSTFSKIWREEGVGGLFKGNFLNLLQIAPTKIVEYLVYENMKEALKRKKKLDIIRGKECMLLGALASMSGTLISHPIDTVRTGWTARVDGARRGIFELSKTLLKEKGTLGLYKGIIPNMMRVAPYAAINFVVYDELQQWYRKKVGPGGELGLLQNACFGVVAGAVAQFVVYPLETVQRRLQAQAAQQSSVLYQNMADAFRIIIQDEGVAALYAGLLPNTLKLVPAAVVSILVYDALQKRLELSEHASD